MFQVSHFLHYMLVVDSLNTGDLCTMAKMCTSGVELLIPVKKKITFSCMDLGEVSVELREVDVVPEEVD